MRKTFKSSTHSTSQPGILNALKNNFSCFGVFSLNLGSQTIFHSVLGTLYSLFIKNLAGSLSFKNIINFAFLLKSSNMVQIILYFSTVINS